MNNIFKKSILMFVLLIYCVSIIGTAIATDNQPNQQLSDLVFDSVFLSDSNPTPGSIIQMKYTLKNIGDGIAQGYVKVSYDVIVNNQIVSTKNQQKFVSLTPNQITQHQMPIKIPFEGEYDVILSVETLSFSEATNDNNYQYLTFYAEEAEEIVEEEIEEAVTEEVTEEVAEEISPLQIEVENKFEDVNDEIDAAEDNYDKLTDLFDDHESELSNEDSQYVSNLIEEIAETGEGIDSRIDELEDFYSNLIETETNMNNLNIHLSRLISELDKVSGDIVEIEDEIEDIYSELFDYFNEENVNEEELEAYVDQLNTWLEMLENALEDAEDDYIELTNLFDNHESDMALSTKQYFNNKIEIIDNFGENTAVQLSNLEDELENLADSEIISENIVDDLGEVEESMESLEVDIVDLQEEIDDVLENLQDFISDLEENPVVETEEEVEVEEETEVEEEVPISIILNADLSIDNGYVTGLLYENSNSAVRFKTHQTPKQIKYLTVPVNVYLNGEKIQWLKSLPFFSETQDWGIHFGQLEAGSYYVEIEIDPNNKYAETNENNNYFSYGFDVNTQNGTPVEEEVVEDELEEPVEEVVEEAVEEPVEETVEEVQTEQEYFTQWLNELENELDKAEDNYEDLEELFNEYESMLNQEDSEYFNEELAIIGNKGEALDSAIYNLKNIVESDDYDSQAMEISLENIEESIEKIQDDIEETTDDLSDIINNLEAVEEVFEQTSCVDIIEEDDVFVLGNTQFEYKSSNDFDLTPLNMVESETVQIKNLETGDTIERNANLVSVFTIKHEGLTYGFKSVGDISEDDYDIQAIYPCDKINCNQVISEDDNFQLNQHMFTYKGSDDLENTNPMAQFKVGSSTIERSTKLASIFTFNFEGVKYYFESTSDPSYDDYDIKLVYPCTPDVVEEESVEEEYSLDQVLAIANGWLEVLTNDLENAEDSYIELENLFSEHESDMSYDAKVYFNTQIQNIGEDGEEIDDYLDDLEEDITEAAITDLGETFSASDVESFEEEMEDIKSQIEDLMNEIENVKDDLEDYVLENEVTEVVEESNSENTSEFINWLAEELEDAHDEYMELTQAYESVKDQLTEDEQNYFEEKINDIDELGELTGGRLENMEDSYDTAVETMSGSALENQLNMIESNLNQLENIIESIEDQIQETMTELNLAVLPNQELAEEIEELKDNINDYLENLMNYLDSDLEDKWENLEDEFDSVPKSQMSPEQEQYFENEMDEITSIISSNWDQVEEILETSQNAFETTEYTEEILSELQQIFAQIQNKIQAIEMGETDIDNLTEEIIDFKSTLGIVSDVDEEEMSEWLSEVLAESQIGNAINDGAELCFEYYGENGIVHSFDSDKENSNWEVSATTDYCGDKYEQDFVFRYETPTDFVDSMEDFTCSNLKSEFNSAYFLLPSKYAWNNNIYLTEETCPVYEEVFDLCFNYFEKQIYDIPSC
ncbi:hypothetical protein HN587_02190 [Candidatus Woesearchaeota archaeon]|jgi:DNA repair exonuclease SbcCD ATPase subunit|nr:hypothetical protein [Candidatus Woesearchaeota archaeon]